MKSLALFVFVVANFIALSGCNNRGPSRPSWIVGEWVPQVGQTKMLHKPSSPEKTENSGMGVLAEAEMFSHCHIVIKNGKVTFFFGPGNRYNRTESFRIVRASENEVDITFHGGNEWRFKKGDSATTIMLNWGPQKAMEFPMHRTK